MYINVHKKSFGSYGTATTLIKSWPTVKTVIMIEAIAQLPVGFVIALSGVLIPGPLLAFIVLKTPFLWFEDWDFRSAGHIFVD